MVESANSKRLPHPPRSELGFPCGGGSSHKFVRGKGLALLVNTVLRVGAIHLGKHAKDYKTWFTYLSPNLKA